MGKRRGSNYINIRMMKDLEWSNHVALDKFEWA